MCSYVALIRWDGVLNPCIGVRFYERWHQLIVRFLGHSNDSPFSPVGIARYCCPRRRIATTGYALRTAAMRLNRAGELARRRFEEMVGLPPLPERPKRQRWAGAVWSGVSAFRIRQQTWTMGTG